MKKIFPYHIRITRQTKQLVIISLVIATSWQILMTGFGYIADLSTAHVFRLNPDITESNSSSSILAHTNHWDSSWYRMIIDNGYKGTDSSPVFYPLYPTVVGTFYNLTGKLIDPLLIGLILNTLFLAAAIFFLYKLAAFYIPKKYRWLPVILFLTSPASVFIHMFYTEAIFCAIGFGAFLFAKRGQWLACTLLLAAATSARIPSLLFIGLCGLEYLRSHQWSMRSSFLQDKRWLLFMLTPLGFVIYSLYLGMVRGDFLAMFHNYTLWSYQRFDMNIVHTLYSSIKYLFLSAGTTYPFDTIAVVNFLLPITGISLLLATSWYAFYKMRDIPLAAFGIMSVIFFSLNSNSVSVHRYLLPILVIYIAGAHAASRRPLWRYVVIGAVYTGVLVQSFLILLFVNDFFAG